MRIILIIAGLMLLSITVAFADFNPLLNHSSPNNLLISHNTTALFNPALFGPNAIANHSYDDHSYYLNNNNNNSAWSRNGASIVFNFTRAYFIDSIGIANYPYATEYANGIYSVYCYPDNLNPSVVLIYLNNSNQRPNMTANINAECGAIRFNMTNCSEPNWCINDEIIVLGGLTGLLRASIKVYDERTGILIPGNVSITMESETNLVTDTIINPDDTYIPDGSVSVLIYMTNSTLGYSTERYLIEYSGGYLDISAYLIQNPDSTIFYLKDYNDNTVISDASCLMYRALGENWVVTRSRLTDIMGSAQFNYDTLARYKFYCSKDGYEDIIFYLDPIIFDSYDIKLKKQLSVNSSMDYDKISLHYYPSIFSPGLNNLSLIIGSAWGELVSYGATLTYPSGQTSAIGTNSYGGQLDLNFTLLGVNPGDTVQLNYYYTLSGIGTKNFTDYLDIRVNTTTNSFENLRNETFGMFVFERILIVTIIVVVMAGVATLIASATVGAALGLCLFGFFSYVGFIPLWVVLIPMTIGLIILSSQSGGSR
jgi:hypothetical protein